MSIFSPVYGMADRSTITPAEFNFFSISDQRWYGLYLQDQINLREKVSLLLVGRYDWAE
jgi:outer membrane receptor protein involved in Fe transport